MRVGKKCECSVLRFGDLELRPSVYKKNWGSAVDGCSPVFFTPSRVSVAPRIHHRLPCDIRHRYRRYRPGDLHRPGGRCGTGYGGHAQLAAGDLVDHAFDISNHGCYLYVVHLLFDLESLSTYPLLTSNRK